MTKKVRLKKDSSKARNACARAFSSYSVRSTSEASSTSRRKSPEQEPANHHVVKMRHNVVGVLQLNVDGCDRENDTGNAANGRPKRKPTANNIGVSKGEGPPTSSQTPVEDLDTGRQPRRGGSAYMKNSCRQPAPGRKHVVRPHGARYDADPHVANTIRAIAEQRLAANVGMISETMPNAGRIRM